MEKQSHANAKGWTCLVVVVALIGAGFLYQREGGKLFPNLAGAPNAKPAPEIKEAQAGQKTVSQTGEKDAAQAADGSQPASGEPPSDKSTAAGADAKPADVTQNPATGSTKGTSSVNSNSLRTPRKTPGTVTVVTKFVTLRGASTRSNGPWLYVNGVLTKDFTQEPMHYAQGPPLADDRSWYEFRAALTLDPGSYSIESVVEGYEPIGSGVFIKNDVFALQTQSRRIQVEADKSVEFVVEFPMEFIVAKLDPLQGTGGVPTNFDTWLRDFTERADQQLKLFDIDQLVSALKEADKALGNGPPSKPATMVRLPESYGGPRELTAPQVRRIVEWLKRKYWGDWTDAETLRVNASIRPNAEANTRQINRIDAIVKEHRGIIEQLNSLARKLDQAKSP